MRSAKVFVHRKFAGILRETENGKYRFDYEHDYSGEMVSLTMPVETKVFIYKTFPPFFDGLLPEGLQLESLLKARKIDRDDAFAQLLIVGSDLVGAVTVEEIP